MTYRNDFVACLIAAILFAASATAWSQDPRGKSLPNKTIELIQARWYADAYPAIEKLSSSGNHQAQFILANYYICGRVVEFSCSKALSLFNAATKPGNNDQSEELVRRSKNEVAWINAACEEPGFVRDTNLAMKYAVEAALNGDPFSIDSVAAVQARQGDFKSAIDNQRRAIAGLAAYARQNPVDSYTFDEFRSRLILYEAHQPAQFWKSNADQNCNTLPNAPGG